MTVSILLQYRQLQLSKIMDYHTSFLKRNRIGVLLQIKVQQRVTRSINSLVKALHLRREQTSRDIRRPFESATDGHKTTFLRQNPTTREILMSNETHDLMIIRFTSETLARLAGNPGFIYGIRCQKPIKRALFFAIKSVLSPDKC